jgi:hypothetical protein
VLTKKGGPDWRMMANWMSHNGKLNIIKDSINLAASFILILLVLMKLD